MAQAKKKVEERKILHGVESKVIRGRSEDKGGSVPHILIRAPERDTEANEEDYQRLIVPYNGEKEYSIISGNGPLKKLAKKMVEIKLLDIRAEEQKDQDAIRFFVKKHLKIFRHLFNQYSNTGPT